MTQHNLPVFVYGTLRSGEGNHAWALAGRTIREQRATLTGARMYANGGAFPFVTTIGATPEDRVIGEVMFINPDQYADVLADLDHLEGYYGPNALGNMYNRVTVTVTLDDGTDVEVYTYLVSDSLYERRVQYLPFVESGDWLAFDRYEARRMAGTYRT